MANSNADRILAQIIYFFRNRYRTYYPIETLSAGLPVVFGSGVKFERFDENEELTSIKVVISFAPEESISTSVVSGDRDHEIQAKLLELVKTERPSFVEMDKKMSLVKANLHQTPLQLQYSMHTGGKEGPWWEVTCSYGKFSMTFDQSLELLSDTEWTNYCSTSENRWALYFRQEIINAKNKLD